ncbi:MAG TPA: alpha/beta hydrolase, partial [Saprospiraceae bacterium]|nr:alpha/beta hydrolase [Saprospiraceae bacterium]
MKKISTIKKMILLVILVLLLIYQIPASQKDFFKTYPKNDYAATTLKDFYNKKTKTVVVNDITWHYVSSGNSDKTILFLHGMGGAYDLWWQQVRAFEKNYKVISYTLPEKITTLEGALTGIKAILQNERVDTFTAVGTSMGGYIAQYLLKNIPDRLEKVVFSNTFPPNEELRRENGIKSKVITLLPEVLVDYLGKKSIKNKLLPAAHNDTLLAAFLPSLPFSKKQFINRYYVVVDRFTFNPSSYNYKKVPKLIIESDNDPLISPQLRQAIKA